MIEFYNADHYFVLLFLPFLLKVSKNAWAAGFVASKNFSTTPWKNAAGEFELLIKCSTCIIKIL